MKGHFFSRTCVVFLTKQLPPFFGEKENSRVKSVLEFLWRPQSAADFTWQFCWMKEDVSLLIAFVGSSESEEKNAGGFLVKGEIASHHHGIYAVVVGSESFASY